MMDNRKLEYKLLFAITVAGKNAKFAQNCMLRFAEQLGASGQDPHTVEWFRLIRGLSDEKLLLCITNARMGKHGRLARSFREAVESGLDLATCSVEQLEGIWGVGRKTSRFFLLWTRPNARCAALDTHILKWLRDQGYKAGKCTPKKTSYLMLEQIFLLEADKRGKTAAELDREIWLAANKSGIRTT